MILGGGVEVELGQREGIQRPGIVACVVEQAEARAKGSVEVPESDKVNAGTSQAVGELNGPGVYTPDDLAAGVVPQGPVVVFDFDNYYLAGAIALQLAASVGDVTYVTTAGNASAWTFMTNELPLVHRALGKAGVPIHTLQRVTAFDGEAATMADVFSGAEKRLACRSLIIVGARSPRDDLYQALIAKGSDLADAGIDSVTRIGDAFAPGAIVHAVHSGHRYAREFDTAPAAAPYTRDFPV